VDFPPPTAQPQHDADRCHWRGIAQGLWAVAIGEGTIDSYTALIEEADDLGALPTLFHGSARLVKVAYLDLVRKQLNLDPRSDPAPDPGRTPDPVPDPDPLVKRYANVTIQLQNLKIGKPTNRQLHLFKVIAEQDAAVERQLTIHVRSNVGISQKILDNRIVEGLEQLGISVISRDGSA
jgi:hypothetical protein